MRKYELENWLVQLTEFIVKYTPKPDRNIESYYVTKHKLETFLDKQQDGSCL